MEARKDDKEKLRYDLIPTQPLQEVARVFTIGARKYDDRNWEKGLSWGRLYAALQRHANAWWSGERHDQVDGQHHLASVAWCALALIEYERTHPELDDRSKSALTGLIGLDKFNIKVPKDQKLEVSFKQGTDPSNDIWEDPDIISRWKDKPPTGEHGGV